MVKWEKLEKIGDEVTYRSQPAFVFYSKKDGKYYYFGDRWGNSSAEYFTSTYVILEIAFDENNNPQLLYCENASVPK